MKLIMNMIIMVQIVPKVENLQYSKFGLYDEISDSVFWIDCGNGDAMKQLVTQVSSKWGSPAKINESNRKIML